MSQENAIVMKAIQHIGITVPDLDAGIDFYNGVLGLELLDPPSPIFDDERLGPAVGMKDAVAVRQVNLRLGDSILELLEYTSPPPPFEDRPVPNNARGAAHLGILVDDAEATKAALETKGIEFLSEVQVVDEGVLAGWRWVNFRDPFGIIVELVEVAYHDEEAAKRGIADYFAGKGTRGTAADITGAAIPLRS